MKSSETGKFYATALKARITSTFDEVTCQTLVGKEMPGRIEKVECEPYEYTIEETGESITLSHTYVYLPEGEESSTVKTERPEVLKDFSENGVQAEI